MAANIPGTPLRIARKITQRLVDGFAYTIDLIGEDLRRRKAIRQLRDLDERMLADIGIVSSGAHSAQSWPIKAAGCPLQ